ncbi:MULTISPECIES: hypothetical protein [unclassified Sphingomonas]|uniref:hypothetical protein n=1 Tax=unclassified Sphingomonas TaxID=196159 RepID=UPI00226A6A00|nr:MULTISPECIES: hypothetical protein [unclassified Sphingomonas]
MRNLPAKKVSQLLDATAFLNANFGLTFNAVLTLNFDQLGLQKPREKSEALTKLNVSIGRRLKRYADRHGIVEGTDHYFVYAHESTRDLGHHVHELIVAPDGLRAELAVWITKWQRRAYPGTNPAATHFSMNPRPRAAADRVAEQARMVSYIIKTVAACGTIDKQGASRQLHDVLGLPHDRCSHSFFTNRPVGWSDNLSGAAQEAAGFKQPSYFEDTLSPAHLEAYSWRKRGDELHAQLLSVPE